MGFRSAKSDPEPTALAEGITSSAFDKTDQVYLKITLSEPLIESYALSGGAPIAAETFSINYIKIKMQHNQFDGETKTEGSEKGWDITSGQAW